MRRTRYLQTGGRPSPFGERQTPYNPQTFNPFNPRPTPNPVWYNEATQTQLIPQGFWQNLREARRAEGHTATTAADRERQDEAAAGNIEALTTGPTQPSGANIPNELSPSQEFLLDINNIFKGRTKDEAGNLAPFSGRDVFDWSGDDNFLTTRELSSNINTIRNVIGNDSYDPYNDVLTDEERAKVYASPEAKQASRDIYNNIQQIYGTKTGNRITSLVTGEASGTTVFDRIIENIFGRGRADAKINREEGTYNELLAEGRLPEFDPENPDSLPKMFSMILSKTVVPEASPVTNEVILLPVLVP